MQGEEPSARLVDTFVDVVGGIELALVNEFAVLKRIVQLGIRHRTGVKPHVYEVALALHGLPAWANQADIVNVWAMQVYEVVIGLAHVARHEAFLLQRILVHHTGLDSLFYFAVEFLKASDAQLFAVLTAPDGERCTPETRAREVPVVQVVEPVAEATTAR